MIAVTLLQYNVAGTYDVDKAVGAAKAAAFIISIPSFSPFFEFALCIISC